MPAPTPVVVGSAVQRRDTWVPPCRPSLVGRGILDAPGLHHRPGPSGMPAPTKVSDRFSHPLTGRRRNRSRYRFGMVSPHPAHRRERGTMGPPRRPPGIPSSAEDGLGRLGSSRPCAARVFRWLRPAGVSPVATGGSFARCGGRVFRPCAGRPGALPPGPRDLGCLPPVGKSGRRGNFSSGQGVASPPWRKRPGEHRRHTGVWAALTRKNSVKAFYFLRKERYHDHFVLGSGRRCSCLILWRLGVWRGNLPPRPSPRNRPTPRPPRPWSGSTPGWPTFSPMTL